MNNKHRGVALLVAVIFTAVMLSFGVLISSLGYKQTLLAQSAKDSQFAFYAADAGLECLLYADQKLNLFSKPDGTPKDGSTQIDIDCDGGTHTMQTIAVNGLQAIARVPIDGGARCADLTIYKPAGGLGKTYIFSQGYSANCDTVKTPSGKRFSTRGLRAHY